MIIVNGSLCKRLRLSSREIQQLRTAEHIAERIVDCQREVFGSDHLSNAVDVWHGISNLIREHDECNGFELE